MLLCEKEVKEENEKARHKHEDRSVKRPDAVHKSGEHVVAPLNDGNFVVQVQEAKAVFRVLHLEFKDTQSLRCAELCVKDTRPNLLKRESSIWVEHRESHLDVSGFEVTPNTVIFLAYAQKVFNFVFDEVVLRSKVVLRECEARAFLLMLDGVNTKDARLLHNPIEKLFAKLLVIVIELREHFI